MFFFGKRVSKSDAKHRDEQLKNGASKMSKYYGEVKSENESMFINE